MGMFHAKAQRRKGAKVLRRKGAMGRGAGCFTLRRKGAKALSCEGAMGAGGFTQRRKGAKGGGAKDGGKNGVLAQILVGRLCAKKVAVFCQTV